MKTQKEQQLVNEQKVKKAHVQWRAPVIGQASLKIHHVVQYCGKPVSVLALVQL